MCAIYGFVAHPENTKPNDLFKLVKNVALTASVRGRDSVGAAVVVNNKTFLDKRPVAPVIFYDKFADRIERLITDKAIEYFIGHNRMATCASITARCAHPFVGERYTVIHNGYYHNEREIRKTFGIDNPTGVDSELILSFVEKYGVDHLYLFLEVAEGPSAIAIHDKEKQMLYLIRDNNPTAFTHVNGGLLFASTEAILEEAIEATYGSKHAEKIYTTAPYVLYQCHFSSTLLERVSDWSYLRDQKYSYNYNGYGYGGNQWWNRNNGYGGGYDEAYYDEVFGYTQKKSGKSRGDGEGRSTETEDRELDLYETFKNREEQGRDGILTERFCEVCGGNMEYLVEDQFFCMQCEMIYDEATNDSYWLDKDGKKIPLNPDDDDRDDEEPFTLAPGYKYWENRKGKIVRIETPDTKIHNPSDETISRILAEVVHGEKDGKTDVQ